MRRPLPNALEVDWRGGLADAVTAHAGAALLIEWGRRSGVLAAVERYLPAKKSSKGLGQGQFVEAFVLLSALGGDCLADFDGLRRDRGLGPCWAMPCRPRPRRAKGWIASLTSRCWWGALSKAAAFPPNRRPSPGCAPWSSPRPAPTWPPCSPGAR